MNISIKLYNHQQHVLELTRGKTHVAYYLDMGLGKTFVGSEKLKELNAPYNLLVCQKSKIRDWALHFKNHYDYEVIVFKNQPLESIPLNSVIIVNYDVVWRRKQLRDLKGFTLMLDESQYIKNEKSRRAGFILGLNPENVILLSGTPTGGKYEELWSQLSLLGWRITKELFYRHYTIVEKKKALGKISSRIKGYKNVDRLKEKLKAHGALFMKSEEAFDLPEQIETTIGVKNTEAYRKFYREWEVTIGGEVLRGDTTLKWFLYMRELASIYNGYKHGALRDALESCSGRVVVFYNFRKEAEIIKNICLELKRPISYINGEGTDLENYETEEDSVTLVQYQAGAAGVNLQKSNHMIYFSLPLSCELWMQSKKRIHRIGQQRTCFYYYLITVDSVEEGILETLRQRRDYTLELFEEESAVRSAQCAIVS